NRQKGLASSGRRTRGGQKTDRSPTTRGTPVTSSGAIWVPSSERQGRTAAAAARCTISVLPRPGGPSSKTLCCAASAGKILSTSRRVTVSSAGALSPAPVVAVALIVVPSVEFCGAVAPMKAPISLLSLTGRRRPVRHGDDSCSNCHLSGPHGVHRL